MTTAAQPILVVYDTSSAIGFYPECPGSPVYEIGSPNIFAKTTIRVANGKQFIIVANHVSGAEQIHIQQSAQLNGEAHQTIPGSVMEALYRAARAWCSEMADHPQHEVGQMQSRGCSSRR